MAHQPFVFGQGNPYQFPNQPNTQQQNPYYQQGPQNYNQPPQNPNNPNNPYQ